MIDENIVILLKTPMKFSDNNSRVLAIALPKYSDPNRFKAHPGQTYLKRFRWRDTCHTHQDNASDVERKSVRRVNSALLCMGTTIADFFF